MAISKAIVASTPPCACLQLRKAARRVTQIYDRHLESHGLTITQFGLLAHLSVHDGIGVGALAEMLVMDPTTLSRTIRPLQRRGWVSLNPCAADKRARTLHVTRLGLAKLTDAHPGWLEAQALIGAALGQPGYETLNRTVERLLAVPSE